ncbi:MAG: DUF4860 domain-containing protein [Clostridiales bacterium]|nr:DUF4860 domain-containing protein [Clostridiales bacterium]
MSKNKSSNAITNHAIGGLFIFCLIALFAVLAVTLTLTGMRAYQSVSEASTGNSEAQIVLSYLLNKVHTTDSSAAVTVVEDQDLQYLCLTEILEGDPYETRIYAYEGSMWEYFCEADEPFEPQYGELLVDVEKLEFQMETPSLLFISVAMPDGANEQLHVALRSQEVLP